MARRDNATPPLEVARDTLLILAGIGATAWVIPKAITAIGAAFGLAAGGAAASAAPWAAPVASIGLGLSGATLLVLVLVKASKEASKEPYDWTVPILGIVGALILDLAKEYALTNTALRLAISAAIAFLVVVAGACYKRGGLLWRTVAVLLILLPPVALLVQNLDAPGGVQLRQALAQVPGSTWLRVGGFLLLGCTVALLHFLSKRVDRAAH